MATEAQTCAIGIITILNILVALHLSRVLYKSTLFMRNKPNFRKTKMKLSAYLTRDYKNKPSFGFWQNKPNTNPIKPNTKGRVFVPKFLGS